MAPEEVDTDPSFAAADADVLLLAFVAVVLVVRVAALDLLCDCLPFEDESFSDCGSFDPAVAEGLLLGFDAGFACVLVADARI